MADTQVEVYDTTLRDGTQAEGLSPTVADKLEVARLIDQLGVHYIEGGWPGTNPKDDEFFARAGHELVLEHATLVAFGSTRRPHTAAAEDVQLQGLLKAGTEVVCIVGKSWDQQVTGALRIDLAEGVRMVEDSVRFLRSSGLRVLFDAEHFFDGYRDHPGFAMDVLAAAAAAGADWLVLCDTNGGTLPDRAEQVVREVRAVLGEAALGVHFHNDGGCAVASSLAAVRAGVQQVQGCMNGYGERTGNADLCSVLPNLVLKMGVEAVPAERLARLAPTARQIAEIMNAPLAAHHPFVGTSAFAHKAGLHSSGLMRVPHAYEHIDPALVGNYARNLVSELMGRSTVLTLSRHRGWELDAEAAQGVVDRVKELEHRGYHFEAADGSFELLIRDAAGCQQRPFGVDSWRVAVENASAEATVELTFGEDRVAATRRGDGPVNALDQALRAAASQRYPQIGLIRLTDYRARDLDTREGSAARVRVLAQWSDGASVWGTVGVDRDIVSASWEALVDGMVVGLLRSDEEAEDLPAAAALDGG